METNHTPTEDVHQGSFGWYFYNHDRTFTYGPYDSEETATRQRDAYRRWRAAQQAKLNG